ncbi:hypothetical protein SAMN04487991_3441 [Celeribacter neptunius]|uniref:Uncharacterized protein n=1 Tax=Celeribacter neptunius TaxID=588602 RepID=A0A1I3VM93_9RHOB|nr:hypothetical protein SAMN04487991_3441 [Celeribacter neptunius]
MDIFSKRDGPRPEDVRAKRLISENAGTIRRLADQISNGGFTKMRQDEARRKQAPKPDGLLIYSMSTAARSDDPDPYVRVSLSGRVALVDSNNGHQIQLLGELRRSFGAQRFVLATAANGFVSPVSAEIEAALTQYEDVELGPDFTEKDIVQKFGACLGLSDKWQENRDEPELQTEKGHGIAEDDSSELL